MFHALAHSVSPRSMYQVPSATALQSATLMRLASATLVDATSRC